LYSQAATWTRRSHTCPVPLKLRPYDAIEIC